MCFWALNNADSPKFLRLFERTNIETIISKFLSWSWCLSRLLKSGNSDGSDSALCLMSLFIIMHQCSSANVTFQVIHYIANVENLAIFIHFGNHSHIAKVVQNGFKGSHQLWYLQNLQKAQNHIDDWHVHWFKSLKTFFSNNIQWNFKISFPCAHMSYNTFGMNKMLPNHQMSP